MNERRRRQVVLLATVVAALGTAALGRWQLDRAAQKIAWENALRERSLQPPLGGAELPRRADEAQALLHRQVRLEGRWLAERTVYLDNRAIAGRAGFFVVTPLALPDGTAVLVQRGWVARDVRDRNRVAVSPPPAGEVVVHGRLAAGLSERYALGSRDGADAGPIRQNLSIAAFAAEAGLSLRPFAVVQEEGSGPPVGDGLVREWPAPAADVHKHYGYAAQWFALCALVLGLYVWFQIVRPRRRRIR